MHIRNKLIILLLIILYSTSFAESISDSPETKIIALGIGYFGETISNPGVVITFDYSLIKKGIHGLTLGSQLGAYVHPGYNRALFIDVLLQYRLTFPSGFFCNTGLGLGYFHSFPDGKVFTVTDSTVTTFTHLGNPAFMPISLFGCGYDFYESLHRPFYLTSNIGVFAEYPYNMTFLPHIYMSLCISYYI